MKRQSKLEIGETLLRAQQRLGESFPQFLENRAAGIVGRSTSTCQRYMVRATAALHIFSANEVARAELFRIWDGDHAFDPNTGAVKPIVDEALKLRPIPKSTDKRTCRSWARQFVVAVTAIVAARRRVENEAEGAGPLPGSGR